MQRRSTLKSLAAASVLLPLGLLGACSESKTVQFQSVDITGADYAKGFKLTDVNGQARTLEDFKGKVVVLFFGFAQCPDVCPTTLSELAEVKKMLGADGDKLQGVFVTVDPERDTPEVLKAYTAAFDPSFVALYADSPEKLAETTKDFKIYFKKVDGKTPGSYTIDHTAASYIYDPSGRLRLYSRYGSGAKPLANDVALLLKGA
ncbi:SCO family protein [Ottowia thiooxydans]|uniref:Protein SCO1/2 n=1 Tax=Ottowia thiooxydans TaxID=219182 RepID=A0ABV2QEA9_9BURK